MFTEFFWLPATEENQKANGTAKLGGGDDAEVSSSSNLVAAIYFRLMALIYSFHYFFNDSEANGWRELP